MLKGIEYIKEMGYSVDITKTGLLIKYIREDVMTEEEDVILKSNLDIKMLVSQLNRYIGLWFKDYLMIEEV